MALAYKAIFALVFLAIAAIFARLDVAHVLDAFMDVFDRKTYEWFVEDCRSPDGQEDQVLSTDEVPGPVHVVYSSDANGFQGLLSSMLSLSRHLAAPRDCEIHVIVQAADMFQARRLVECFKAEHSDPAVVPRVTLHEVHPLSLNFTDFRETWTELWPAGAPHLTQLAFTQLSLGRYLPTASRAIWLDANTVVRDDLGKLYRKPMRNVVAAARDLKWATWRSDYAFLVQDVDETLLANVSDLDSRIFNAGVLLVDLERWRTEDLGAKLEAWVKRASGIKLVQLALNLELHGRIDELDWSWNVMGLMMVPPRRCLDGARVLHFTGAASPFSKNQTARQRRVYEEFAAPFVPKQQCSWQGDADMLDSDPEF
eukprot:TRINITY_DN50437_c0_g1_i1.p1 TRINITY_DN50437_c0_g1~~TRINITY_DN50437_c0_g1_i1.p1  ORF type:complete len:369 (-),score=73.31 TRINITY_DN50437_c0_g1_i1:29-1135(-)